MDKFTKAFSLITLTSFYENIQKNSDIFKLGIQDSQLSNKLQYTQGNLEGKSEKEIEHLKKIKAAQRRQAYEKTLLEESEKEFSEIQKQLKEEVEQQKTPAKIREALNEALAERDQVIKEQGADCEKLTDTLNMIGYFYELLEDFDNAIIYYEQLVPLLQKYLGENSTHVGEMYEKIGKLYQTKKDYHGAIQKFKLALPIVIAKIGEFSEIHWELLNQIGYSQYEVGDYEEAIKTLEEAKKFTYRFLNQDQEKQIFEYEDCLQKIYLGNSYRQIGKAEESLKLFSQVEHHIKHLDKEKMQFPEFAQVLTQLGLHFFQQRVHQLAIHYFNQAIDVYDNVMENKKLKTNEKNPLLKTKAANLYYLGQLYHKENLLDHAKECLESSLEIQKQVFKEDSLELAPVLFYLGTINIDQEKFDIATEFYEKCLKIQEKYIGYNDINLCATLEQLGNCKFMQEKYEDAIHSLESSWLIKEKYMIQQAKQDALTEDDVVSSIYLHEALCVSYLKVKNFQKSLESGSKVLALKQSYLGEVHEEIAFTLKNLGAIYHDQKDYNNAIKFFKQSLEMIDQVTNRSYNQHQAEFVINTLKFMAIDYRELGENEKFEEYYTQLKNLDEKFRREYPDNGCCGGHDHDHDHHHHNHYHNDHNEHQTHDDHEDIVKYKDQSENTPTSNNAIGKGGCSNCTCKDEDEEVIDFSSSNEQLNKNNSNAKDSSKSGCQNSNRHHDDHDH